jgi:hypothetical protein
MRIIAELACRTNGWTSPIGSEFKVTTSGTIVEGLTAVWASRVP